MSVKRLLTALACSAVALTAHAQLSGSGGTPASGIVGYDGQPAFYTGPADAELMELSSFNGLLNAGAGGTLQITYLGSEAAHNNRFKVGDFSLTTGSHPTPFSQSYYVDVGPGNVNFSFRDMVSGTGVSNGGALSSNRQNSYFLFDSSQFVFYPGSDTSNTRTFQFILGFNDAGGDKDFDDMVIGLNLMPVPEPGTYALMLAGLAAVGFVARRRRGA